MTKYRNEAAFSRALCAHLRKNCWFVQRIETGRTGRGVPDIYAISPFGQAVWLELKRVHKTAKGLKELAIPWRPGQQSWLMQVARMRQDVRTLVACDDCILIVSHTHLHQNGIVKLCECQKIYHLQDL